MVECSNEGPTDMEDLKSAPRSEEGRVHLLLNSPVTRCVHYKESPIWDIHVLVSKFCSVYNSRNQTCHLITDALHSQEKPLFFFFLPRETLVLFLPSASAASLLPPPSAFTETVSQKNKKGKR